MGRPDVRHRGERGNVGGVHRSGTSWVRRRAGGGIALRRPRAEGGRWFVLGYPGAVWRTGVPAVVQDRDLAAGRWSRN